MSGRCCCSADEVSGGRAQTDWVRWAAILSVSAMLLVVASWQAASLQVGFYVSGGFAGVAILLHLAAAAAHPSRGVAQPDAVVSVAARRDEPGTARQPDADDPAGRRVR